jgi:benzoyl-CoA reductase/2-hydroxyglutaryl-CoA dehydratase subunit BcrC/BadD/HgdB
MMEEIGLTTTIPVEIILAAGETPVDLNNIFISDKNPLSLVHAAERAGFPRTCCAWIKGIYAVTIQQGIKRVIGVTQGDCNYNKVLMEIFQASGIEVIPFAYPPNRDSVLLKKELEGLISHFGASGENIRRMTQHLNRIREKLHRIDQLTWQKNLVSGYENHIFLVRASDMTGDPVRFEAEVDIFLNKVYSLQPYTQKIRLGYIGVPPIYNELYHFIETLGARVVYNETQRQFTLPQASEDLIQAYRSYTYPYDIWGRIRDIQHESKKRNLHGLIHYIQSFCYRQLEELVLKKYLDLPILTIEGDIPNNLEMRTKTRLEAFIDLLKGD